MRPRRQKGEKRYHKGHRPDPTNLSIPGYGRDGAAALSRRLIVAGLLTPARACDTKARFASYAHATKAASDIAAKYNDGQTHIAYPCPFCGAFHLASVKVTSVT